jgi:hypothetical protein
MGTVNGEYEPTVISPWWDTGTPVRKYRSWKP